MSRVLIACEESQVVTVAFRELGIEAYSCDVGHCSGLHPEWHIQQDVLPLLKEDWSIIIAFPPCTHLAVSGACRFAEKRLDGRQQDAINFFLEFTKVVCKKVAIENPVGIMNTIYRKPDQIIQPYMFGHKAMKSTCLWLKGLPRLISTNIVENDGNKLQNISSKDRALKRSKTYSGIALTMAEQWSRYV